MSDFVLVTGASGRTGKRMIAALSRAGVKVRAFVRRADAEDEVRDAGAADVVVGDLLDETALRNAVRGTGQVLHICPPMHPQEDELARRMTNFCAMLGVRRLVLYSVLHPLVEVPHHRRKLAAERYLVESGLPYTILQPCRYMAHVVPIWKEILATGVHRMPFSVDAKFSLVDLNDLAEATAHVVTEDRHDFATYQLAGPEPLSQADCARIISEIIGAPVRAEAKPLDQFRAEALAAGIPPHRVETLGVMNAHYDVHGLVGNPNVLRWLLGREPTGFGSFVKRELVGR